MRTSIVVAVTIGLVFLIIASLYGFIQYGINTGGDGIDSLLGKAKNPGEKTGSKETGSTTKKQDFSFSRNRNYWGKMML